MFVVSARDKPSPIPIRIAKTTVRPASVRTIMPNIKEETRLPMHKAYESAENLSRPAKKIKKPVTNLSLQQAPPLRHIGLIVIWEGNYKSDTFNIGFYTGFLKGV